MKLQQTPWFDRKDAGSSEWQFTLRLLESALRANHEDELLQNQLPDVASELQAQWVGLVRKTPQWELSAQFGHINLTELPFNDLDNALDGGVALFIAPPDGDEYWPLIGVPFTQPDLSGELLLFSGRDLRPEQVGSALMLGWGLGSAIAAVRRYQTSQRRSERLEAILKIASQLSHERETVPLLELIANEATRLLEADRASIFIWDKDHRQVIACPALGVEGGTLRLSDSAGIVGEVIQTGKSIQVDEAYRDARFDKKVDVESGYITENLLCVPLLNGDGERIGAFEVINKLAGAFTAEDEESLTQLGIQAATALQSTQDREQLVRTQKQLTEQVTEGVRIVGESPAITALKDTIERLAATELPVLILGESGTGKEVVSQSLHYHGPRRDHPFVAVNCAALAETLLESELFGHEKGAFTDAHEARQGKFELAEGGTLFLDEIGDMTLGGQAKLLRVLEQKVITRVGGSQTIPINVRVVAATNANLSEAVRTKKFREDLYYRLGVVTLDLPPLRDRPEDVILLAEYFLSQFSVQAGRKRLKIAADARRRLQAHSWPGNIRELRNLMERVAFLAPGEKVEVSDLAFILSPDRSSMGQEEDPSDGTLADATKHFQQRFIRGAVKRVQGNMSEAARMLGLHRSNLYRKMRQLEMGEAEDAAD
ncbi:sigma-54-dependent Fis family transcriptional regulator [Symmachiella dynata]|uniref:sigma-54-dependent Fis family transcriptional regulator n=1 Tax=Symmachiella dynata TaxID=2527995 RepID=UPI0030ED723A